MAVNAVSALSTYTYQSALNQTGNPSQALTQALTASQTQVAQMAELLGSASNPDPMTTLASLAGGSASQALASLAYGASAGNGTGAPEALLAALTGSGSSAFLATSDQQPFSTAMLSPASAQALVRYAYDQSQNPASVAAQASVTAQQTLLSSGLNLLA